MPAYPSDNAVLVMLRSILAAAVLAPLTVAAAPGDVLFNDTFEDGALAPWSTSNAARSGVSNNPGYAGSGAYGAYTRNGAVSVTSPAFSAAVPEARLDIWVRRGADSFSEDTDNNDNLVLEYRRADNSWAALRTYFGSGSNGQVYNDTFYLPPDALHGALALRLRQTQGSGFDYDYWHFDDVVVSEAAPAPPLDVGACEDFENGLGANWNVTAGSGYAGVSSATSASPLHSMYLNGGIVEVQSNVLDTSDVLFSDLTLWIRRGADSFSEDPDGGEDLIVEYFDDAGNWVALETFTGSGGQGQAFVRSYDLPAAGRHSGFRLRFRMTGGSGAGWDYWHVDDVCLVRNIIPLLQLAKMAQTLSDPVNGGANPFSIPGAVVQYTISVTNQGPGVVDAGSMVITDPVPPNTALFVDTGGGDPIVWIDGVTTSGLTYSYATDVTFSIQAGGGPPYDYTPEPDAQGFDPAVTGFRIEFGGAMNGASGGNNPSFNIRFRTRVE